MQEKKGEEAYKDVWMLDLAYFLWERQGVEAVVIDRENKKISVATLGVVDEGELKRFLGETLKAVEAEEREVNWKEELPRGVRIKFNKGKAFLEKDTCETAPRFWKWREYGWPEEEEVGHEHEHEHADWRELAWLTVGCAFFGIMGFLGEKMGLNGMWVKILYVCSMVSGGWDALGDVRHKVRHGEFDIHFLMLSVAVGACFIGGWREGALLLFLFSLSSTLEHLAQYKTRQSIEGLLKLSPKEARYIKGDGEEGVIMVEKIEAGMVLVVRPGELFCVDGEVMEGKTAVDESSVTGESLPIDKEKGDSVYSGTMNLWGVVRVKVVKLAKESALQKIIHMIKQAQRMKAPSQRFTERFGTVYTGAVFSLVTVMFFVWWLGKGLPAFVNEGEVYSAFYRAMTLLVVASPCALVLSIPSAILAAIAWSASKGILFRGGAAIEKLSEVDVVAMDKTGTLTTGELSVVSVESFPEGKEEYVLSLAYSMEKNTHHPIARAIVKHAVQMGAKEMEVVDFKSMTGKGVKAMVEGNHCFIGKRQLLELGPLAEWVKKLPETGKDLIEVWLVHGDIIGRILLRDRVRVEAKGLLEAMHGMGLRTVMLTGDRTEVAEAVGKELGVQEVRGHLKPEEKVGVIKGLMDEGKKVAMIGDGVNDAPSLAMAYVSVAMGVRGSDAALEQSEVVLMNDRLDYFLEAYGVSRRARRVIRMNLVVSLVSIMAMVVYSCIGEVPLTLGVLTHEGSTVFVCLNSLRLLAKRLNLAL